MSHFKAGATTVRFRTKREAPDIKCTMALARCKDHPPDNTKARSPYVAAVAPLKPCVAVLCGRGKCTNEAFAWLTASEKAQYEQGIRIFDVRTHCIKIRVADELEFTPSTRPVRPMR